MALFDFIRDAWREARMSTERMSFEQQRSKRSNLFQCRMRLVRPMITFRTETLL